MKTIYSMTFLALLVSSMVVGPETQVDDFSIASSEEENVRQGIPGRRISGSSRFSV